VEAGHDHGQAEAEAGQEGQGEDVADHQPGGEAMKTSIRTEAQRYRKLSSEYERIAQTATDDTRRDTFTNLAEAAERRAIELEAGYHYHRSRNVR
jgi:hypothetical protein